MLTEVFGDSPRVKLLDFLMDHVDFDYTISQMHEFTGISRPTLYPLTEELVRAGMIVLTREVGGSRFFQINVEHPKVVWMLRIGFEEINKALDAGRIGGDREDRSAQSRGASRKRGLPSSPPRPRPAAAPVHGRSTRRARAKRGQT